MPVLPFAAAAVSAGATIYASSKASKAAKNATNAQTQAAADANKLQWDMYQQQRTDQAPWREVGQGALGQLAQLYNIPYKNADGTAGAQRAEGDRFGGFFESPDYQFRMDQGVNALDRSASARGAMGSGGALKAITRYGQGLASSEYGNWYNRLAGLAGVGQAATNQTGQAGQNYANQANQNLLAAGDARASGYQNQSQIQTGMIGGLANLGTNLLGSFSSPQPPLMMNSGGSGGYAPGTMGAYTGANMQGLY